MANRGEQSFRLHKLDDRAVYEIMKRIRDYVGGNDAINTQLLTGYSYSDTTLGDDSYQVGSYDFSDFRWSGRYDSNNQTIEVSYRRYKEGTRENDPYFDIATVHFSGEASDWSASTDVIRKIIGFVTSSDLPSPDIRTMEAPDTIRMLISSQSATHQKMMNDLNEALRDSAKQRQSLDKEAALLEAMREEKHQAAMQEIQLQRDELDRTSHMAERRRLGKQITTQFLEAANDFPHKSESRLFGTIVFIIAMIGGSAAAVLSYQSLSSLTTDLSSISLMESLLKRGFIITGDSEGVTNEEAVQRIIAGFPTLTWFLAAKTALSGIFAIGAFTYAANWMRKYYDDSVDRSRRSQQMATDIARASWVIEAIHEVHQQEGADALPAAWVESVTRNLFSNGSPQMFLDEGTQALRALMGFTASASFGPDGPRFEVGKKGAKELARSGDTDKS